MTSLFRTTWRDVVWFVIYRRKRLRRGERPSQEQIRDFYRSWEWDTARFKAIKRFKKPGWRCRCCNHRQDDGARIVIDHIKPIRWYWNLRTDQNNLQPLCHRCNRGKGSWDETDFRMPTPRSRLANTFRKTARTEIDSFVRDIAFRGRTKEDE